MSIQVTPIPRLTLFGDPALTLGLANAAGSAVTTLATDSTLLAFDGTLPADVGTAATGVATVTARRDHVHSGGYAKVGTFTVNSSTASWDQSISGVGFTPKAILFMGLKGATREIGFGMTDGTNEQDIYDRLPDSPWGMGNFRAMSFYQDGTKQYSATIKTLDSDGFTLAWVRTGTPSGLITIMYLAIG